MANEIYFNTLNSNQILLSGNTLVLDDAYSGITLSGLTKWLDAGNTDSYPGTGTNWYDLVSGGATATLTGSIAYNSLGGGSMLNTTGRIIMNSSIPITNTNNALTMSIWLRIVTGGIYQDPVQMNDLGFLQVQDTNRLVWYWYSVSDPWGWYGDTTTSQLFADSNSSLNTWYNVVCVNDGTNCKMYINGTQQTMVGGQSDMSVTSSSYNLFARSAGAEPFKGYISQYLTYNRALSQSEITQNFNAVKDRYGL